MMERRGVVLISVDLSSRRVVLESEGVQWEIERRVVPRERERGAGGYSSGEHAF